MNFLCQKSSESFSIFFSLKNTNLEAHFLLLAFFDKINSLTTLLLKLGQIFDEVAKLGKSTQEAYNPGKWLILWALLKNWVAGGIASDVSMTLTPHPLSWWRGIFYTWVLLFVAISFCMFPCSKKYLVNPIPTRQGSLLSAWQYITWQILVGIGLNPR